MPSTAAASVFRAAQPAFRSSRRLFAASAATRAQSRTFPSNFFTRNASRRFQSSSAGEAAAGAKQSLLSRLWNSPVGMKTVHFWAPVMKWAIVLAGISDLARPVEKLSVTQNGALTATGLIWTRWCLIIKPKNYFLATVNFFLGMVGLVQVGRIAAWHLNKKGQEEEKKSALPAMAA